MKKIFMTLFLMLLICLNNFSIKIGYYDDYPMCFKESTRPSGIFVDIINHIYGKNNIEWIYSNWTDLLNKIKNKKIDFIVDIAYTKERTSFLNYPRNYVVQSFGQLFSKNNLTISEIKDLKNKKTGVMKDDIYYVGPLGIKNISDSLQLNIKFVFFNSYVDILKALAQGKIDVGIVPQSILRSNYKIKASSIIFSPIKLTIASSKVKKNKDLLTIFDTEIEKMKKDQTSYYYTTLNKYQVNIIEKQKVPRYIKYIIIFILLSSFITLIFIYYEKKKNNKIQQKLKKLVDKIPFAIILHNKNVIYYTNKYFKNISRKEYTNLNEFLIKFNIKQSLFYSLENDYSIQKIKNTYYKIISITLKQKKDSLILTIFEDLSDTIKKENSIIRQFDIDILEMVFDLMNKGNYNYKKFIESLFLSLKEKKIVDFFGIGILKKEKIHFTLGMPKGYMVATVSPKNEKTVSWYVLKYNKSLYIPNNLNWKKDGFYIKIKDETLIGKPSTLYICPIPLEETHGVIIFGKIGVNAYAEKDRHILDIILKQIVFAIKYRNLLKNFYEEKEHYKEAAIKDQLTNLYTRYFFNGWILNHYEKIKRNSIISTVVMIDINKFKYINDNFGHLTGDMVLKEFASVILKSIRGSDLAVRFGGDEFLIIFDNFNLYETKKRMKLIQKKLSTLKFNFELTISYGISVITKEKTWMQALKEADKNMYDMKNNLSKH